MNTQWCLNAVTYNFSLAMNNCEKIASFLMILLSASSHCSASQDGVINISKIDLGAVSPGQEINEAVEVENTSNRPVRLTKAEAIGNHRFDLRGLPIVLEPRTKKVLELFGPVESHLGRLNYFIDLLADEKTRIRLPIEGLAYSRFDPQRPEIDIGVVRIGERSAMRISFTSNDFDYFRLIEMDAVIDNTLHVVTSEDDCCSITVSVLPKANWGAREGRFVVRTNKVEQPEISIVYKVDVRGTVVPSSPAIDMGIQRKGELQSRNLILTSEANMPLVVDGVSIDGSKLQHEIKDCPVRAINCKMLEFNIDEQASTGELKGVIRVAFPDYDQQLSVGYRGLLVNADTEIRNLFDKPTERSDSSKLDETLTRITSATSIIQMPIPLGDGPLLQWQVRNDVQIYGYLIYRADTLTGDYARRTALVIPSVHALPGQIVKYRWRDDMATPGKTYWYKVIAIDEQGMRSDLAGPVERSASAD